MKRIFEHIGGVPARLRFDNMTTAVARVLRGTERVLTDGFNRFMLHYRFQADFCNPASGNEKGNVENKVGYSRRNAFVPVPKIAAFADFNEYLWEWCEKDAQRTHYIRKVPIQELWEEERSKLLELPAYDFPVFRYTTLTVGKSGFTTIDTNRYGLSPTLAGETVQAKIFFDHVEFFHDHIPVGQCKRGYGSNEEIYDWTQYVTSCAASREPLSTPASFARCRTAGRAFCRRVRAKNERVRSSCCTKLFRTAMRNCARTRWLWLERTGVPMQTASASATT